MNNIIIKKENNRNIIIDIMKGLLMILVIIGHFNFFEYEARTITLIYSFHMPAFFIIAGYLSHIDSSSNIKNVIVKRFNSTIIPYYLFYFLSFIIMDANGLNNYNMSLKYMFNGIGNPDFSVNLPLWFLTLYFCATTIYEIVNILSIKISTSINNSSKNKEIIDELIFVIFIIILSYISFIYCRVLKGIRLIYNFETALLMLPFMYIGRLFKIVYNKFYSTINKITMKNNTNKYIFYTINIFIFILILIIWYILSMKNLRLDLNARNIRNLHLTYTNGILGTILLTYICYILKFTFDFSKGTFS